jgi:hypothetical protein
LATQTHNKHKHKQTKKHKNQYDLTLVASDSLNESVTRVVILIKDSNDLPPIFNQTMYTAHALEELADPLPFKLLQVASTPQLSPDLIQLFFLSSIPKKEIRMNLFKIPFFYYYFCRSFCLSPVKSNS